MSECQLKMVAIVGFDETVSGSSREKEVKLPGIELGRRSQTPTHRV